MMIASVLGRESRHLSLTAILSDAFATRRTRYVIDSPTLADRDTWRNNGRIARIGITWTPS
jgi:L-amino acid N-acyltransferase YncA